jgi:hypothetical protein
VGVEGLAVARGDAGHGDRAGVALLLEDRVEVLVADLPKPHG